MASSSEADQVAEALDRLDVERVRELGRNGLPDQVRADSWRLLLLGPELADKTGAVEKKLSRNDRYLAMERQGPDVMKRIRGEVSRYYRARSKLAFKSEDPPVCIENVVSAYLTHFRGQEYSPIMIYFAGSFAFLMPEESNVYFCFSALMGLIEAHYSKLSLADRISEFLLLFRTLLPDLHNYFEEEEVDFKACATSWFQYLLSKELPLDSLLRLWDTYLCASGGFDLHTFVCLAILSALKENLEELEQSEIQGVLLRLPSMDMDNILNQAMTLREEVKMKNLLGAY